jgi:hypothetical protein
MSTRKTRNLPADLENTRRRLEQWRQRHQAPTPLPESLWAEAVKLAGRYGVSRTARALGVGYYSLKDRVEKETSSSAVGSPAGSKATFLELAVSPRSGAGECILEWEHAGGGKMRVHLKGVEVPDLVALSRSFWEGRR